MTMAENDLASTPMLGDLVEMPDTGPALAAALAATGRTDLIDAVNQASERLAMAPEAFARLAVRRFCERAEDEDWVQVMGTIGRDDRPGAALLAAILDRAVKDVGAL